MGVGVPGGSGGGPAALSLGLQIAGYLLEDEIGAGGMAVVFRARDERLDLLVALKVLAPGWPPMRSSAAGSCGNAGRPRRWMTRTSSRCMRPVRRAGGLFIAMRLVSGGDVRGLLHREGPLPSGAGGGDPLASGVGVGMCRACRGAGAPGCQAGEHADRCAAGAARSCVRV